MVKIVKGINVARCFIPISKLKNNKKILENDKSIETLYPVNKKIPQIRLGSRNYMKRQYLGATDKYVIHFFPHVVGY